MGLHCNLDGRVNKDLPGAQGEITFYESIITDVYG